jgi:hypothetical protein
MVLRLAEGDLEKAHWIKRHVTWIEAIEAPDFLREKEISALQWDLSKMEFLCGEAKSRRLAIG